MVMIHVFAYTLDNLRPRTFRKSWSHFCCIVHYVQVWHIAQAETTCNHTLSSHHTSDALVNVQKYNNA